MKNQDNEGAESRHSNKSRVWLLVMLMLLLLAGGVYYFLNNFSDGPAPNKNTPPTVEVKRFSIPKPSPPAEATTKGTGRTADLKTLQDREKSWIDRKMALIRLGQSDQGFDADPIIGALSDDNVFIRCEAAVILGQRRIQDAEAVLMSALDDRGVLFRDDLEVPAVADAASAALSALGDPSFDMSDGLCIGASLASHNIDSDIRILQDKSAQASKRSIAAVALGWTRNERVYEPLFQAAYDEDAFVRAGAVEGLGNLGDQRGMDLLIQSLRQDSEYMVRKNAASSLGRLKGEGSVRALADVLLSDKNIFVRTACAEALGLIGDQAAVQSLETALEDPATVKQMNADGELAVVRQVAEAAAAALEKLGKSVDREEMAGKLLVADIEILESSGDDVERASAAERLAEASGKDVLAVLVKALESDSSWRVRVNAARSLGKIGDKDSQGVLQDAFKNDPDIRVRNESMAALEEMDAPSHEPPKEKQPEPLQIAEADTITQETQATTPTTAPVADTPPAAIAEESDTAEKETSEPEETIPEPPLEQTSDAIDGISIKTISIQADGFIPTAMFVKPGRRVILDLSVEKPEGITKAPVFHGSSQLYGLIALGVGSDIPFYFVFDHVERSHPILYLDTNRNGDLSDDGGPTENAGPGVFGASVFIPFTLLDQESGMKESCRFWLYTKADLWERKKIAYYSWSQFKGTVKFGDKQYTAYIGDFHNNDGDYTNDGISIDLNANGSIEFKQEYFYPDDKAMVGGREYRFVVQW